MNLSKGVQSKMLRDFSYELVSPSKNGPGDNLDTANQDGNSVVLLIGWTGGKDRHLSKYSAFYEKKGFTVIRYSPSAQLMFGFDPEKVLTRHATSLIEILRENNVENKPLFFHFFSNGGAVMYYLISKQLEELASGAISGCIFDSSPARMTNKTTLEAIASVVPGNAVKKYFVGAAAICFLWFSYCVNKLRDLFTGNATEAYRLWVWYTLMKQPNLSPQLFLYSKGDKIADYRSIDTFIEHRQKLGVVTNRKVWDDSTHVCHFKSHPDEYNRIVEDFLQFCSNTTAEPVLGKFGLAAQMERDGLLGKMFRSRL